MRARGLLSLSPTVERAHDRHRDHTPARPKPAAENAAPAPVPGKSTSVETPDLGGAHIIPLPLRRRMERAFGESFADVTIHHDGVAAANGAKALTRGNDIHVADGHYDPATRDGVALIAHELTHVIQQRRGGSEPRGEAKTPTVADREALETEAEAIGERVADGGSAGSVSGRVAFGTQQHDDKDAAIAAYMVKLTERPKRPRVVPPPTIIESVGDRFKISFERDSDFRLVIVVDYQGMFTHGPPVRLVAPEAWETADTDWRAEILELRSGEMVIDFTGDGAKILKVRYAARPSGNKREHSFSTDLNGQYGASERIEITLPDSAADAPLATAGELAAERKVSAAIELWPDKLTVTARCYGDTGLVHLFLDGTDRRMSSQPNMLVPFDGKHLSLHVLAHTQSSVDLDLDGDHKVDLRLTHTIRKMPRKPELRWHDVAAFTAAGRQVGRATYVVSGPVIDIPDALREPPRSARPAKGAAEGVRWPEVGTSPRQDDRPIERSGLLVDELRIDADGDRRKELLLRFREDAGQLAIRVEQIGTPVAHVLDARVKLEGNNRMSSLDPVVVKAADGHSPMQIDLFGDTRYLTTPVPLLISPPVRNKDGMALAYTFEVAGTAETLGFAADDTPDRIALVGNTSDVATAGGVAGYEAELGELHDRFLFTLEHAPGGWTFAISGRSDKGAVVGGGVRVRPYNPGQAPMLRRVEAGASRIGFSFDQGEHADVVVYDAIQGESAVEASVEREHRLTITGQAVGSETTIRMRCRGREFEAVRSYDKPRDEVLEREVAGGAHGIVAIGKQSLEGHDVSLLAEQFRGMVSAQVVTAGEHGRISGPMYEGWKLLTEDMNSLSVPDATRGVLGELALRTRASFAAITVYNELVAATKGTEHKKAPESRKKDTINNYTGEEIEYPYAGPGRPHPGPAAYLAGAISTGDYAGAVRAWDALRAGVERWAAARNVAALGPDSDEVKRDRYFTGMARELDKIKTKPSVQRVYGMFIADDSYRAEENFHAATPLQLYVWRDGSTWHICDITNPEHTFSDDVEGDGTDTPPHELFKTLNDKKAFPKGLIRYQIPDGRSGTVICEAKKKWYEWVQEIGMVVAAVGMALATFGTGTIAVIGSYVMAASMVAGAVASGAEIYDDYKHGQLTAMSLILNVLSIVSGIASAGAIVAGSLVKGAVVAANEAKNWTGAMARIAKLADKAYIPLIGAGAMADGMTVAVMSVDLLDKLREIDAAGGNDHARTMAKAKLIAHFAVMGGITALSIKGSLPEIAHGKVNIVLDRVGGELVAYAGGVHVGGRAIPIKANELGAAATARWNAPSLEAGVKGANREWYEAWLVQKEKVRFDPKGEAHAVLPEIPGKTIPADVKEHLEGLARSPQFAQQQRALAVADEVAELRRVTGGLDIDPTSAHWPKDRERLINKLGGGRDAQQLVDRYAQARLGALGADHAAQHARLTQVLPKEEVSRIAKIWPEYEVYVTGQAIAPGKAARKTPVTSIEIVIVVPEGTSMDLIGAIEQRATGQKFRPDPDYVKSTPGVSLNDTLPVEVRVMTPDQMFGASTAHAKGGGPMQMHRIDVPENAAGVAYTKGELEAFQRAGYEYDTTTRRFRPRGDTRVPFGAKSVPLGEANRVIGTPLSSQAVGQEILERLAAGEVEALRLVGIEPPPGFDPRGFEWGVGRRTHDGTYVLVHGERGAVNWAELPGIERAGHMHPLYTDPLRPNARLLKGNDGSGGMTFEELQTKGSKEDVTHLLPSGSDLAKAAEDRGEHFVVTPYVYRDGRIANPIAGDTSPVVVWHITGSIPVAMIEGTPYVIYRARLRATAGGAHVGEAVVEGIQFGGHSDVEFGAYKAKQAPLDPSVRAGMELAPIKDAPATTGTGATTRAATVEVHELRPGLYDKVDTKPPPETHDWSIKHDEIDHPDRGEPWVQITTTVKAKGGGSAELVRAWNPDTKELVMQHIEVEGLPKHVMTDPPLVPGTGTPTVTYLSLLQMKELKIAAGSIKKVTMTNVKMVETVLAMHKLTKMGNTEVNAAIRGTESVRYARTALEQAGQTFDLRMVSVDMSKAKPIKVQDLFRDMKYDPVAGEKLATELGISSDTIVLAGFDITINFKKKLPSP